jgi:hypothetical protein
LPVEPVSTASSSHRINRLATARYSRVTASLSPAGSRTEVPDGLHCAHEYERDHAYPRMAVRVADVVVAEGGEAGAAGERIGDHGSDIGATACHRLVHSYSVAGTMTATTEAAARRARADRQPGPHATSNGAGDEPSPADVTALAAEQAFLLNVRSLVYSETSSRVATFLTALGAATVTLGLIAGQMGFSDAFLGIALVLLIVVSFLGWSCFMRLLQLNMDDAKAVMALNRIRHAHGTLSPRFGAYLSGSMHDDVDGMLATNRLESLDAAGRPLVQGAVTSASTVCTITSVLLALVCADVVLLAGAGPLVATVSGVIVFVLVFAWHTWLQWASWERLRRTWRPRFPGSPGD